MVRAFSAYTDFCYLIRRNVIDEDTLGAIDDAVHRFHRYRVIFKETNVRADTVNGKAFSLPRQHAMIHYRAHIENFGAPNGLCSSITESKHVVAIKRPWRRSSRYQALCQMLIINSRMDKLSAARRDFTFRGMMKGTCLSHALRTIAEEDEDAGEVIDGGEDDSGEVPDNSDLADRRALQLSTECGSVEGTSLLTDVFLARTKGESNCYILSCVI